MKEPAIIQIDHVYAHPPAAVWRALTDPALHARWWAAGDVKPVLGTGSPSTWGGQQPCEVVAVEPERLLRYKFAAGTLDTLITWRLTPEGRGTHLTLIHEEFNLDSPMGRQAFEGMGKGWPQVLARLEPALAAAA